MRRRGAEAFVKGRNSRKVVVVFFKENFLIVQLGARILQRVIALERDKDTVGIRCYTGTVL